MTLPPVFTNYVIQARLYMVLTANNHGLNLPIGGQIDTAYVVGGSGTYIICPFSVNSQGDNQTYVVQSDGDASVAFQIRGIQQLYQIGFVNTDFQLQAQFSGSVAK